MSEEGEDNIGQNRTEQNKPKQYWRAGRRRNAGEEAKGERGGATMEEAHQGREDAQGRGGEHGQHCGWYGTAGTMCGRKAGLII